MPSQRIREHREAFSMQYLGVTLQYHGLTLQYHRLDTAVSPA